MSRRSNRREQALKKARQRKMIIIASAACAVVLIAVIAFIFVRSAGTETFTDGYQIVNLYRGGRFDASLYHDENYAGTYKKEASGGDTLVYFSADGYTEPATGLISNGILYLPNEWEDDHSHGSALRKK